jgi:hypothetical protein
LDEDVVFDELDDELLIRFENALLRLVRSVLDVFAVVELPSKEEIRLFKEKSIELLELSVFEVEAVVLDVELVWFNVAISSCKN